MWVRKVGGGARSLLHAAEVVVWVAGVNELCVSRTLGWIILQNAQFVWVCERELVAYDSIRTIQLSHCEVPEVTCSPAPASSATTLCRELLWPMVPSAGLPQPDLFGPAGSECC